MSKKLNIKCPRCKDEFSYYSSDFRPFCSEKCKMIDLGHWLTETYSVPAQKISESEVEELISVIEKNEAK